MKPSPKHKNYQKNSSTYLQCTSPPTHLPLTTQSETHMRKKHDDKPPSIPTKFITHSNQTHKKNDAPKTQFGSNGHPFPPHQHTTSISAPHPYINTAHIGPDTQHSFVYFPTTMSTNLHPTNTCSRHYECRSLGKGSRKESTHWRVTKNDY